MKRKLFLFILFLFILTGCDKDSKPENLSQAAYDYGISALQRVDDFIDLKISADDCCKFLEEATKRIKDVSADWPDDILAYSVETLEHSVSLYKLSSDITNVIDYRNSLAEKLNQPKR